MEGPARVPGYSTQEPIGKPKTSNPDNRGEKGTKNKNTHGPVTEESCVRSTRISNPSHKSPRVYCTLVSAQNLTDLFNPTGANERGSSLQNCEAPKSKQRKRDGGELPPKNNKNQKNGSEASNLLEGSAPLLCNMMIRFQNRQKPQSATFLPRRHGTQNHACWLVSEGNQTRTPVGCYDAPNENVWAAYKLNAF